MSVTEELQAPGNGPPADPDAQFERTPPQDIGAEQSVLGGMMLSKDAIADVVEILRSADFYRPAHATIFETILDLYGRGEPADPVMVVAALTDAGSIARVGGMSYVHDLVHTVPTAANAAYYARIVAERAVLRRLVEAGTRIVQLGYGAASGARDTDDVVDLAQQTVYDVTERRVSEDFAVLAELLQPTLDEIEAIGAHGGVMAGVPTGFADLDALLHGLHPSQLVIVAGRPGTGKALALDTPLPTPDGWTTMGSVRVGERLLDADGRPTTVLATSEIQHGRPCYEVEFSDGSAIVADGAHRWLTRDRRSRRLGHPAQAHSTEEILATLRTETADRRRNHSVTNARPLELPERSLPIPPYTLGVWLGDGSSGRPRFTTNDPEIVSYVEADGFDVRPSGRQIGVLHNRHIPSAYLRASESQRRALLAGLLDTGGEVSRTGSVEYASTSRRLADDVYELIVGLGYRCTVRTRAVRGRHAPSSTAYTLNFSTSDDVFRLERKRLAHKERRRRNHSVRTGSRFIVDVRRVASVPVRCVTVDNPSSLYLAGRAMIPTHNSTLALDVARHASLRHGLASAIFSLEMSKVEIVMRVLSAESRVPLHVLRSGQLSDDDWTKLARRMGEISEAPLFVDDTPNMTLMEIRAKARRLRQRHDLKLLVVDYLQLMTSPKRVESRQQEVSELSRGLKLLAKEVDCPVIAAAQLNRGPEQRTDKRPQLADLRESGCVTASTRLLRADDNTEITIGELMSGNMRNVPVWALDEGLRMVPRTLTHAFPSGRKEVFRVQLTSGKEVEATANHPFLTVDGWVPLDELEAGSRVATPRRIPPPPVTKEWPEDEIVLLAHMIGDGSMVKMQPIRYASVDEKNLEAVAKAATHFGVTAVRDDYEAARVTTLRLPAPYRLTHGKRNPIAAWLDSLGLFGKRSHEKFVPAGVFSLSDEQAALFLRHLWATDGSVLWDEKKEVAGIYYSSTSLRLVEGVRMLLLRFGVHSTVIQVRKKTYKPSYNLHIYDGDDQLRWLREIGVYGERARNAMLCEARLLNKRRRTKQDTIPPEVWRKVKAVIDDRNMKPNGVIRAAGVGYRGVDTWRRGPSRSRLARIADILGDEELRLLATNDLYWDGIKSVESVGERDVYDATVVGEHNFIANSIVLHNSVEQDSDVVILLHRDDYYDKESPRAGEADLIVAKHRNGPTDTVTVAAQLHLSRFVDMAIG